MDLDPAALKLASWAWFREAQLVHALPAAIRAYLAAAPATPRALPPEPPPGFVRVRVAAAAWSDGSWQAEGSSGCEKSGEDYRTSVWRRHNGRISIGILDIPLPAPGPEIVGTVERGA